MTEIQEMAQAIHEKHKALWPLTWAVADFMAKQLAGDQGYLIVNQLTHELMELNNQQTEIPTTKHKPHCLLLDPEEPQCHCSCGLEPAPAQDEREFDMQDQLVPISKAVADGDQVRAQHLLRTAIKYIRPAQTEQQPVSWQFYQDGKWWNGDDRIKDHRKNTEAAGIPVRDLYAAPIAQTAPQGKFRMGDLVKKSTGSEWEGRVVGWYSTEQTKEGYAVESSAHRNSVQIYPAKALEAVE